MSYLFGGILTVSLVDLYLLLALCLFLVVFFILFLHSIIFISFDEDYARTQGIPVSLMNYILIALVALTIVFNIRVVGIILAISLLTIPQTISNFYTSSFVRMMILSIIIGLIGTLGGLIISYYISVPSGAAIIILLVIFFLLARLIKSIFIDKSRAKIL
jgi:zinc transport system permease protein